jgi:hypothetical protein
MSLIPTTRCKFRCNSVEKHLSGSDVVYTAKMDAVYDGSPENEEFWKWTPSGQFNVSCVKHDRFVCGKEYYIDVTEAPAG